MEGTAHASVYTSLVRSLIDEFVGFPTILVSVECGNVSGVTVVIIVYAVSSRYTKAEQWV